MPRKEVRGDVPVEYEDHGAFVLWDLSDWEGDIETLSAINDAWVEVHTPPNKVGTISVFPDAVVVDDRLESFIDDGWNEAGRAVGLEYLAIVGNGLATRAVREQMSVPDLTMDVFNDTPRAVRWMRRHL